MDPATLIGIGLAVGAVFGASYMAGLDPIAIFLADIPSIIMVSGGAIGVTIANNTMPTTFAALKSAIKALTGGLGGDPSAIVAKLVDFADLARKEGLLALESRLDEIDDPFFRRGMELAVDGTDPEVVREMLELEVESMQARHKMAAGWWATAAGMGPAMGMIGTVIGLVDMLGKLDDPSSLGPSMAVAFLTTLWGAFLANVFFTPISGKLKQLSAAEVKGRELIIEGILAVQAGSNPRAVAGKLAAFLPPSARESVLETKSA